MLTIKHNGHILEMYDGIEEMPYTRFQSYQRHIMLDSGIGSDMNSVDSHLSNIARFANKDDKDGLKKEVDNLRQNFYFITSKTSPEMMAFVSLIKSINGIDLPDVITDMVLDNTQKDLMGKRITVGKIRGFLTHVKKNLKRKLKPFSRRWARMVGQSNIIQT